MDDDPTRLLRLALAAALTPFAALFLFWVARCIRLSVIALWEKTTERLKH